jgi:hypothetical protein
MCCIIWYQEKVYALIIGEFKQTDFLITKIVDRH